MPDRLYQAICDDIRTGVYAVGERLPVEAALCDHYGVSRTVLRETVARLRADGLIDAQQGRGTFVLAQAPAPAFRFKPLPQDTAHSVVALAELRLGVEGTAAALAARRRTPAHLARLKDCLERMERAIHDGTSGTDADVEFHQTIADATGNAHYRLFMDYLRQFYAAAIDVARARSARADGLSETAQAEHRAVYEAIAAGDADAAERAIKAHIQAAADRAASGAIPAA